MSQNSNLKDFFASGFYDEYWAHQHTAEVSQQEADQVLQLLGAKQGHILDWRGGWGRHAIHFARRGFQVTILDFIGRYLAQAQHDFHMQSLPVTTIEADCRQTPSGIQADYATCLMNSVGFFAAAEELQAFKSLHAAIRQDGKLVVDCVNGFWLAREFQSAFARTGPDGSHYRSQGHFNFHTNVLHKEFEIIKPDGAVVKNAFNQTMYTPKDLQELLTQAGFQVEHMYGSYAGEPLAFGSPKIVLVARA
jgi:hypothetical protein